MFTNLFLASSSKTRQLLLTEAGIPFEILTNTCTPEPFEQTLGLKENVQAAAFCKATHVDLPYKTPMVAPIIYVITADTLITAHNGAILQKPHNLEHAKEQLTLLSAGPCTVGTSCVVQKFKWNTKKGWKLLKTKHIYSKSTAEFYVPQESFNEYFSRLPIALYVCGAGIMEGFGSQFLKKFHGSYSGTLGLPLSETKKALQDLGWLRISS